MYNSDLGQIYFQMHIRICCKFIPGCGNFQNTERYVELFDFSLLSTSPATNKLFTLLLKATNLSAVLLTSRFSILVVDAGPSTDDKDIVLLVRPKKRRVKRFTNRFVLPSYTIADIFFEHLKGYSRALNLKKTVSAFRAKKCLNAPLSF